MKSLTLLLGIVMITFEVCVSILNHQPKMQGCPSVNIIQESINLGLFNGTW